MPSFLWHTFANFYLIMRGKRALASPDSSATAEESEDCDKKVREEQSEEKG